MTYLTNNSKVSNNNSTNATLTADSNYTGDAERVINYKAIILNIVSDTNSANSGVVVEFSADGSNWDIRFTDTYLTTSTFFSCV